MPLHICGQTTIWRNRGVKQMSWASYLFNDINEKSNPVAHLAPSTDEEIVERIIAPTSSYMTESNENTSKPDTVFESFHQQDLRNGGRHPECLVGIGKKPVSSGGCCKLPGQASDGLGEEARNEDS